MPLKHLKSIINSLSLLFQFLKYQIRKPNVPFSVPNLFECIFENKTNFSTSTNLMEIGNFLVPENFNEGKSTT